jgi:hypothetical protein
MVTMVSSVMTVIGLRATTRTSAAAANLSIRNQICRSPSREVNRQIIVRIGSLIVRLAATCSHSARPILNRAIIVRRAGGIVRFKGKIVLSESSGNLTINGRNLPISNRQINVRSGGLIVRLAATCHGLNRPITNHPIIVRPIRGNVRF